MGLNIFEGVTLESILLFISPTNHTNSVVVKHLKTDTTPETLHFTQHSIPFEKIGRSEDRAIQISLNDDRSVITEKLDNISEKLEAICYVTVGINTGYIKDELTSDHKVNARYHKMLSGSDISRYDFEWDGEWICYDPELVSSFGDQGRTLPPEYIFTQPKLLLQRTRRGMDVKLVTAYDDEKFYNLNRLSNVVLNDESLYSIKYILALLNSHLLDVYFNWVFNEYEVKPAHLRDLPIRKINFKIGKEERNQHNHQITSLVSNKNALEILMFVEARLSSNPSDNDFVHDLLVLLAERMIELNKQKQTEMRRLLGWLEGVLKVSVDELTGKSKVRNYIGDYQKDEPELTFAELDDILFKNKNKVKVSLNDSRLMAKVRDEYEKSLGVLRPIKSALKWTDDLIDQVVYRLYGLTEEEIAIVQGRG